VNLRAFHVVFISAAVALSLGVGWWCLPEQKAGAAAAVIVAVLLVVYEAWFLRKTRSLQ